MPMAHDEPLYEAFYGFREPPFALSTDPRFFFLSESHHRVHEDLLAGLRRREGILLLTGEAGTGKTTLCRALLDSLGHRTFSALIVNPYMSDAEVLRVILREFGLVSRDEIRRGALARADMTQLLEALETFLRSLLPLDSYAVLIIDEAQSLAPVVLDQIRILGGFEVDGRRLLQIVLVGQPALAETVRAEPMRALNERITRRTSLTPLTSAEVDRYITHRLTVAGGRQAVTFDPDAVTLIADLSRGLPRRVNLICDRALEEGRLAGRSTIDTAMVRRAARAIAGAFEMTMPPGPPSAHAEAAPPAVAPAMERPLTFGQAPSRSRGHVAWILALGLLMGGLVAGGYWVWTIGSQKLTLPPAPAEPRLDVGQPPPASRLPSDDEIPIAIVPAQIPE